MKSFDKDLKKYSEKIKLKVSERRALRERVLSYMEYHPLPKQGSTNEIPEGSLFSEAYTKLRISPLQLKISGALFVLLLIVIPVLAERSVPGEVLYALKTGVNEKIQGQLANSPYEKIEFETKLMERRIAEARVLASEGKLTEEAKDQFEETVKEHAQAVRHELTELRVQDADGAALAEIAFNSSLDVQSTVLGATEAESEEEETSLEDILTVVNDALDETLLEQEENKPSYVGLVAQIETQTTRAYELFETVKETATEEEIIDIERRLSDINRLFEEAKEGSVVDKDKSVGDSTHVLGLIQKLVSFMTNIDVREAVALESLVPVVLSLEERTDIAAEEILSIGELVEEVLTRLESLEEAGVVEKVETGIATVEELISKVQIALEFKDIETTESILSEARALITDLDAITAPKPEEVPVEVVETPIEEETSPAEEETQEPEDVPGEVVEPSSEEDVPGVEDETQDPEVTTEEPEEPSIEETEQIDVVETEV